MPPDSRTDLPRRTALAASVLALAGCSLFTKETGRVSVDRRAFLNAWGRTKVAYDRSRKRVERLAKAGCLPPDDIAAAKAIDRQVMRLAAEIDAKAQVPESEPDWALIMKLLELVIEAAI